MSGRHTRVERGALCAWGPELTVRIPRFLGHDLKPVDLFAVGLAVYVTGDSQLSLQSGSWKARLSDVC